MIPTFTRQRWLLILGDVALILMATQLSSWIRSGRYFAIFDVHTGASAFTLLVYLVMLYIFDLYNMSRTFHSRDTALRIAVAVSTGGFFSTFLFYALPQWKYGRGIFLIQMMLVWIFLRGWRLLYVRIFPLTVEKEDVLILGAGTCGMTLFHMLEESPSSYRVVGFLDDDPAKQGMVAGSPSVLGTLDELPAIAPRNNVKTAILAITHNRPKELIRRLMELRFNGLTILDMPTVCEKLKARIPVNYVQEEGLLFAEGFLLLSKDYVRKVKRLIDFGVSAILLLVTLPVTALTALAIRLDSPGPVFFRQSRVGVGDKAFKVWKFRSMKQDAEENGAVWAQERDPRVTRVGRWIRPLRIDEIPQFINVLRGEMSLIGPRPERPEFVRELTIKVPYYSIRHSVRPGITGWAQVNYRYGASVADALAKLEYDIYYIKNMSLLLDIKILLKTIGVVIFGQGAR